MNIDDLSHSAEAVAPELLGAVLTCVGEDGPVSVVITETEAYSGFTDPASHAYRGRTPRNAVMFGPAGHLYVYRSHGLHWCANVVTATDGVAAGVLLRAGRVVAGEARARRRRGGQVESSRLARGPGNLCRALGITGDHNGTDLLGGGAVTLSPGWPPAPGSVRAGPRVGVSRAADWLHRFYLAGDPTVSAYRASPRAVPSTRPHSTRHPRPPAPGSRS
ncbi:DNA-3-methyladenine glycosylase [Streptomyces sp. WMMC905]|uniref:DNA-3-methyladenine glycosylase n=1 Tax=Streptomyces sp. WMMC905 TaxID=3404123 RepID=UPI0031FBA81F